MSKQLHYYVREVEVTDFEGNVTETRNAVFRRVTRDLAGITAVTSDSEVSPSLEAFRVAHPNIPVSGEAQAPQRGLSEQLAELTNDQLEALGLSRRPAPAVQYPIEGKNGWFTLSNGDKIRAKTIEAAEAEEAELHRLPDLPAGGEDGEAFDFDAPENEE